MQIRAEHLVFLLFQVGWCVVYWYMLEPADNTD